jgi:hypothetical protein
LQVQDIALQTQLPCSGLRAVIRTPPGLIGAPACGAGGLAGLCDDACKVIPTSIIVAVAIRTAILAINSSCDACPYG